MNSHSHIELIEETGRDYDHIIFEDDYIPSEIFEYQINRRNKYISTILHDKKYNLCLDLGCGTGYQHQMLSELSNIVIGVDISLEALKNCRKKYAGDYIRCDIHSLPFKENSFNLVYIAGVLHHIPNSIRTALNENVFRILKPCGKFIFDEPNKHIINYFVLFISKADPTGEERPLNPKKIVLKNPNNIYIEKIDYYSLFGPLISWIHPKLLFQAEKIDFFLEKTMFKKFLLRWIIIGYKKN